MARRPTNDRAACNIMADTETTRNHTISDELFKMSFIQDHSYSCPSSEIKQEIIPDQTCARPVAESATSDDASVTDSDKHGGRFMVNLFQQISKIFLFSAC